MVSVFFFFFTVRCNTQYFEDNSNVEIPDYM